MIQHPSQWIAWSTWAILFLTSFATSTRAAGVQLDLSTLYNAKAASTGLNDTFADFDGSGRAYPVEHLPSERTFAYNGIKFALPPFHNVSAYDTVRTDSQTFTISSSPDGPYFQSFHALAIAVWPPSSGSTQREGILTFTFEDGSTETGGFVVGPWSDTSPYNGVITTPFHYANATLDDNLAISYNITSIAYVTTHISNTKPLRSITLPAKSTYINFFAISLLPSATSNVTSPVLGIQTVRSTTRWFDSATLSKLGVENNGKVQIVEVTVNNLAGAKAPTSSWIKSPHLVSIASNDLETVVPGRIVRLRNNDGVIVKVGVRNRPGVPAGKKASAKVKIIPEVGSSVNEMAVQSSDGWNITAGIPEWTTNDESMATHEAAEWFDDVKFGIFIHWGVYSVPAWAPSGKQYAEWYNWQYHNPPNASSPTWTYHLEHYGADVVYDDFIANFTASAWDANDWTDFFVDAGAKYFVLVTKHHDGFALFDTGNSSHRNSVQLGPKRDFLKELMESAKSRHPELHRGTYYSIPEWFHPDWEPYSRDSFPGRPAVNPYNGSCCDPYTGYIPVDDFLLDIHKPQMEALFYTYETEILWCDIGGYSAYPRIGAAWYNNAASQDRQVVVDNRCGANHSDFVTPEYATFPSPLSQKWESSSGMDPFSYGYNSDTPSDAYQNATSVLVTLIDIVSKGGNYLVDIGPKSDGSIIPEERGPLLEVGAWLKHSGQAIYSTRPWTTQPADTTPGLTDVRFTTTINKFYIIAIGRPAGGYLKTAAPVPILPGDKIILLGGSGKELEWNVDDTGVLSVAVSEEDLSLNNLPAWAFEVTYG